MARSRQKIPTIVGFVVLAGIFLVYFSVVEIRSIPQFQSTRDIKRLSRNITATPAYFLRSNLSSSFLFSKDDIDFKPTAHIHEQKCDPIFGQPPKNVASFRDYGNYKNLTELITIHGDSETPLAICSFFKNSYSVHFPHMMQQLYMCYTFWQDNPSREPVLYPLGRNGKEEMIQIFSKNHFLKGFMELLISQLKVKIFNDEEIINWLKANMTKTDAFFSSKEKNTSVANTDASLSSKQRSDKQDFGSDTKQDESYDAGNDINFRFHEIRSPVGYVLSHVDILNQIAQQHFDFGEGKKHQNSIDHHHDATPCSSPRIGILNRKRASGRSITNAEYLVQNITLEILTGSDIMLSSSSPVSLTYFDGHTFEEQVRFFHNIDLLISPHGAQLTGIPFLANKPCTQIIECFPDNYLLPDFFGSLARDSGVEYSYIYASNTPEDFKGRIVPSTYPEKVAVKRQDLCISPALVVDSLKNAVRNWCKCKKS